MPHFQVEYYGPRMPGFLLLNLRIYFPPKVSSRGLNDSDDDDDDAVKSRSDKLLRFSKSLERGNGGDMRWHKFLVAPPTLKK